MSRTKWIGTAWVVAAVTVAGCSSRVVSPPASVSASTQPVLKSISYYRWGGSGSDRGRGIVISQQGTYQILGGPADLTEGKLSDAQIAELVTVFYGWEELEDFYPGAEAMGDTYQIEIRYGDKTVMASDSAPKLPAEFRRVWKKLDELAGISY